MLYPAILPRRGRGCAAEGPLGNSIEEIGWPKRPCCSLAPGLAVAEVGAP